jgi:hypothetical protein
MWSKSTNTVTIFRPEAQKNTQQTTYVYISCQMMFFSLRFLPSVRQLFPAILPFPRFSADRAEKSFFSLGLKSDKLLPLLTLRASPCNWEAALYATSYPEPGVDVMITIFCNFCQFSAEKMAFCSKTNVTIKILHDSPLFWVKNANFFAEFFGENI